MRPIQVQANVAKELFEISSDFASPIEVLRESLHNAYDAGAQNVQLVAAAERLPDGRRVLTITVSDDGQGMSGEMLDHFFGLGWSDKPQVPGRDPIGFKGHGTKIFYQASEIAVLTRRADAQAAFVNLYNARNAVFQKTLPQPESLPASDAARAAIQLPGETGTTIRLRDFTPDSGNLIDAF
ncbi:MAG: ATP-binding protein, partial [Pirellulales bacterium]